jgi:hypothetical protein
MKKCNTCGEEIHPKRLEILPTATQCVKCSTTGKKAGIIVTIGEGDHTYNDIVIMDHETFNEYRELEHKLYGKRSDNIEHPDEVEDEEENVDGDEIEDELDGIKEIKEDEDQGLDLTYLLEE